MVAFSAVGPSAAGAQSATTPLTWTHVCGASDTHLLVFVTTFTGGTNTVTSVTYAGAALTLLGFVKSNNLSAGGIAAYIKTAPATGSNTVSVAFTGAASTIGGSVSVTGAGSNKTAVTSFGSGTAPTSGSIVGTTTSGLIVSAFCTGTIGTQTATSPNVLRWSKTQSNSSGSDNAACGTAPSTGGGANQTVVFGSTGNDDWGLIAVELIPPGGSVSKAQRTRRVQGNPGAIPSQHMTTELVGARYGR